LLNAKNVYFVPFRQDDPVKKANSVVADNGLLLQAAQEAIQGRQVQPLMLGSL